MTSNMQSVRVQEVTSCARKSRRPAADVEARHAMRATVLLLLACAQWAAAQFFQFQQGGINLEDLMGGGGFGGFGGGGGGYEELPQEEEEEEVSGPQALRLPAPRALTPRARPARPRRSICTSGSACSRRRAIARSSPHTGSCRSSTTPTRIRATRRRC